MTTTLPPDPWKVLGIERTADKAEIRKAHRKLVMTCHPDKVLQIQDEALKALKQDEFHKVQQAYELLMDDAERAKYEERYKLQEMKKQAEAQAALRTKNQPNISASRTPPRSVMAQYFDVRIVEPRSRPSPSYAVPQTKIYTSSGRTKSYEENVGGYRSSEDEYRRRQRETSHDKPSRREEEARESRRRDEKRDLRREEEDRERERAEKKARKLAQAAAEKDRAKEKRSGTEEKSRRKGPAYVEEYREEEVYAPQVKVEKKKMSSSSSSSKKVDEPREKSSSRRERAESPRVEVIEAKMEDWKATAADYIERHRVRAAKAPPKAPGLSRAATFQDVTTSTPPRVPVLDDLMDEGVRRSSAARIPTRRPSDSHELPRRSKDMLYSSPHKSNENIDSRAASPPPSKERSIPPPPVSRSYTMPPVAEPETSPRTRDMSSRRTQQVPKPQIVKSQTWAAGSSGDHRGFGEYMDAEADTSRRHHNARHEVLEEPALRARQPIRRETSYKVGADRRTTTKVEGVLYDDGYGYDDRRGSGRRHHQYEMMYEEPQYVESARGADYYYDQQLPFKVKTSKPVMPEDVQYSSYGYPQASRSIYAQS